MSNDVRLKKKNLSSSCFNQNHLVFFPTSIKNMVEIKRLMGGGYRGTITYAEKSNHVLHSGMERRSTWQSFNPGSFSVGGWTLEEPSGMVPFKFLYCLTLQVFVCCGCRRCCRCCWVSAHCWTETSYGLSCREKMPPRREKKNEDTFCEFSHRQKHHTVAKKHVENSSDGWQKT